MIQQSIAIRAPLETVFKTITDFESYPDFLPEIHFAEIESKRGHSLEATFKVSLLKEVEYTLHFMLKPTHEIRWKLKKSNWLKKNSGCWVLTALEPGLTDAQYRLDLEVGFWVPQSLIRSLVEKNLSLTLQRFKKRAEAQMKKKKKS